jgi:hypothetical protein
MIRKINTKAPLQRKIDLIIEQFEVSHQNKANRALQWLCIPLITFGILGMVWSIPFPHLTFLGRYNGFVNWASFIIAFAIYYYYKLSPLLSYGILLFVFACSAGIVTLENLHKSNSWPEMGLVCLGLALIGVIVKVVGVKMEHTAPDGATFAKSLLDGPLWLTYLLFRKA